MKKLLLHYGKAGVTFENEGLTEDIERKGDPRQAEALKEAQGAEHGDVDGEGYGQTKHQHEEH